MLRGELVGPNPDGGQRYDEEEVEEDAEDSVEGVRFGLKNVVPEAVHGVEDEGEHSHKGECENKIPHHFQLFLDVVAVAVEEVHTNQEDNSPNKNENNNPRILCDLRGQIMILVDNLTALSHRKPTEHGSPVKILESMLNPIGVNGRQDAVGDVDLGWDVHHGHCMEVHPFGNQNEAEDKDGYGEGGDVLF